MKKFNDGEGTIRELRFKRPGDPRQRLAGWLVLVLWVSMGLSACKGLGTGNPRSTREGEVQVWVDVARQHPLNRHWVGVNGDPFYFHSALPPVPPVVKDVYPKATAAGFKYLRIFGLYGGSAPLPSRAASIYYLNQQGIAAYDFSALDQVLQNVLHGGLKPMINMTGPPRALCRHPETPQGSDWIFTSPPIDYRQWEELVYQTVKHCKEKFGAQEIESWFWEVWNEPDHRMGLYMPEATDAQRRVEYYKIYDYTVAGAVRAHPRIQIGGPALSEVGGKNGWMDAFLAHCAKGINNATGEGGSRIDFLSWHSYGAVLNNPIVPNIITKVHTGAVKQFLNVYPQLAKTKLFITEWNLQGSHPEDPLHHTHYAAAFAVKVAKELADTGVQQSYFYRLFDTDRELFSEGKLNNGLLNQWWVSGERTVHKPVYHAFLMLRKLLDTRCALTTIDARVDGLATISVDGKQIVLLLYHWQDMPRSDGAVPVLLRIEHWLPAHDSVQYERYVLDREHSNPYTAWQEAGRPAHPSPEVLTTLRGKSTLELGESPRWLTVAKDGRLVLSFTMPMHSISLIMLNARA